MIKRVIFVLCFISISLFSQMLNVENFSSEVFSRATKKPVSITLSAIIEGRYVEDESYKIIDALNIVIGSFYLEDLVTSQGKENLKKAIEAFSSKKYGVDIDNIYLQKFNSQPNTTDIIDALKKEGMCIKN